MNVAERVVYYGMFVIGIGCAYALVTRQLGPHDYGYFALGFMAVIGVIAGGWKLYDDCTR